MTDQGFLVLADISGFTAFVTSTELEHGAEVTGLLLEAVMRELAPPLEIQEVEGDAVFAIGADGTTPADDVSPVLARAFAAFKEQQAEIGRDESCSCGACRRVPNLNLKLIVHHGRFVRQTVGGRSRVAGVDVILVHQLLKNQVGADAYLLFTAKALERAGLDPTAGRMRPYLGTYPHLGEVEFFVADLETASRVPEATQAA